MADRHHPDEFPPADPRLRRTAHRRGAAGEGNHPQTVRTYTEAVRWFPAADVLGETSHCDWDQVGAHDLQSWMASLLGRYSDS
jgi:hypothetical protein